MAVIGQDRRVLSLSTAIGQEQFLLSGFSGIEGISRLFSFRLDLLAENKPIALDQIVGQPVSIELALPQGGSRFFSGIVARISQGARDARFTSYTAELVPHLWLLTRRQGSRTFEQRSVPDIVRQVLGDITPMELRLEGTFEPRDYCVQYRESDFDFVSRLMEEEGIFYFFRHEKGQDTLVLANTPQAHPDVPGSHIIGFDASGARGVAGVISEWSKTQELRSGKVTLRDHNFELPDDPLEASALIRESVRAGQVTHSLRVAGNDKLEVYDYPGAYAQRFDGIDKGGHEQPQELQKIFPEARRAVAIRVEQEAAQSLLIEGSASARNLVSGHRFSLSGHFNADGGYVITSVEHSGRTHDPEGGSITYDSRFTCIPEALPYRPPRTTPRPTAGPQPAVVVRPSDVEIYPDKYGRVKVQFFWDRAGKNSMWVRVAQPHASKDAAAFWLPDIGDEVLVAFEHGDIDRPYVIGSLYNPQRQPPRSSS